MWYDFMLVEDCVVSKYFRFSLSRSDHYFMNTGTKLQRVLWDRFNNSLC